MSKGRGALCAAETSPAPFPGLIQRLPPHPLATGNCSGIKGTGAKTHKIWSCLSELPPGAVHAPALAHTVFTGARVAALQRFAASLSPFLIHHFYACFSQITFAWLWPWWPAECKCLSAATCLDHMDCQHATRIETETPLGFKARFAGVRAASTDQQAK